MMRIPLAANQDFLALGYGAMPGARNWDKLAAKLSKPGSKIQLAVFGNSITQGYHPSKGFAETWAHELQRWLQAAFPTATVELINLARDATDVTPAAMCWYQRVPADADLVVIDYSLGGCGRLWCAGVGSELVANYESLLRRLMRNAPGAALLLLENFHFATMAVPGQPDSPVPYYSTGGDMHWMLARRYRVPMVSVRDALYNFMFNDTAMKVALGLTRDQIMADVLHPNAKGHRLIGQGLVAFALRSTLQQELLRLAKNTNKNSNSTGLRAMLLQNTQLPDPVSPLAANEADGDTFCAEGRELERLVLERSSVQNGSWQWVDSQSSRTEDTALCAAAYAARGNAVNCANWGLAAKGMGKRLEFVVDTKSIPTLGNSNKKGAASDSSSRLDRRRLVVFFDRGIASGPGVDKRLQPPAALLQCVRGCSCSELLLGGSSPTWSELSASGSTEVSQHPQCVVRVTIADQGARTNDWFKVNGIAVVPYNQPKQLNMIDEMALAREQLFVDAFRRRLGPRAELDFASTQL